MQKLRHLIILSFLTASETIRQPVCLLLTIVCVVLTMAVPLITAHNFGDGGRLARDSGLAFHLMFGLFISCYAACSALDRERKAGTTAAILSKPVSRGTFFIAKFFGIFAVIAIFSICTSSATMLAERVAVQFSTDNGFLIDYRTDLVALLLCPVVACCTGAWNNFKNRRSFHSTAMLALPVLLVIVTATCGLFTRSGEWHPYHPQLEWQIINSSSLITLQLTMLAAIALTLAVRLSLIPTISLCSILLVVGLSSDFAFGQFVHTSWIAKIFYTIVPNWQNFWTADYIANNGTIPFSYIAHATLYGLLYTSGILCLGVAVFKNSEVS